MYTSPTAPAMTHATVLIRAGKIAAIGRNIRVPVGTAILPCGDCTVFAGFWNAHVHFTGTQWEEAAAKPAGELTRDLQAMLTHSGFTTVVDVASDPSNTVPLRRRVESGEVAGPKIHTSGFGLYSPHGIPFYLDDLPESVRAKLPQPESPAAAVQTVRANQAHGSDVVKLFTGSYLSPDTITHMPLEIAELIGEMVKRHVAMTPTLKLFSGSGHIDPIRGIVAAFYRAGGRLLFGTDTGFLTDDDVREEYHQLQLAGLTFPDVLAMLTTNPVEEFHLQSHAGQLRVGYDGDLTVLSEDPSRGDLRKFARVRYTIRAGKVIFNAGLKYDPR